MAFTMSGVEDGYSYSRFDSLQEKKGKDDCPKCKGEKCKCDEKKKSSGSKPDYLDFDKDGDKEEPMTDALGEGFKSLPKMKMARQADKAYGKEQQAVRKGDEAETNKQMQRRIAMTNPSGRKAQLAKEELEQVDEARKEGESPKEYAKRVTAKFKGGKSKTYDPMKDSSFDHDEAEKTRGQSGKVAEGYQRNPEKGEEKSPGRGEKTPMPPRGDKRREEFEKWYAKNVREDVDLSIFGDNEIEALIGLYEEPEQIDEIVGAALAGIGDAVGGAAKGVGNAVGGVAKGVGSAVKGVGKGVGKAASGVGSAAGGAVDGVKKTASGVTEETTRYHSYTEAYASMYQEGMSALDMVKANIEKQYGKGAIIDTKAPKKEMSPEDQKKDAARRAKNYADNNKGYNPYKARAGESD